MDTRLILVLALFFTGWSPYSIIDPIIPFERKDSQINFVMTSPADLYGDYRILSDFH